MKKATPSRVEVVAAGEKFLVTRQADYKDPEFSMMIYIMSITPGEVYSCSCSKFSRDGLHCCHVLAVATHNGLSRLPESFINPRWTVAAGHVVAMMTDGNVDQNGQRTHLTVMHSIVMSQVSAALSNECTDDRSYDLFVEGIDEAINKIGLDKRLRQEQLSGQKRRCTDDPQ
ncbi:hypothetical protein D1007_36990 [Hordeum vulgare]|nr:hypothetical protein D1007_36990 [Hordeum vulgare]